MTDILEIGLDTVIETVIVAVTIMTTMIDIEIGLCPEVLTEGVATETIEIAEITGGEVKL